MIVATSLNVLLTTCLLLGHLLDGLKEARQCLVYGSNDTQTQAPMCDAVVHGWEIIQE